jgi:phosphopantetheine--protein transferase-like protein
MYIQTNLLRIIGSSGGIIINSGFNVGIDCEDIDRWERMLTELEAGPQHNFFSEGEHQYCRSHKNPAPYYAARWCAKEALLKACNSFYKVDLRLVSVERKQDGSPFFVINDLKFSELNLTISLSMTHSRQTAMAIVMVAH